MPRPKRLESTYQLNTKISLDLINKARYVAAMSRQTYVYTVERGLSAVISEYEAERGPITAAQLDEIELLTNKK